MPYYSGQGKVLVGKATDGNVGVMRYIGNCPNLQIEMTTSCIPQVMAV